MQRPKESLVKVHGAPQASLRIRQIATAFMNLPQVAEAACDEEVLGSKMAAADCRALLADASPPRPDCRAP